MLYNPIDQIMYVFYRDVDGAIPYQLVLCCRIAVGVGTLTTLSLYFGGSKPPALPYHVRNANISRLQRNHFKIVIVLSRQDPDTLCRPSGSTTLRMTLSVVTFVLHFPPPSHSLLFVSANMTNNAIYRKRYAS